jgi:hypothetical protein
VRGLTQEEAGFMLRASVPARLDERVSRTVLGLSAVRG